MNLFSFTTYYEQEEFYEYNATNQRSVTAEYL